MLLSNPHLAWAPSFMTYFEAETDGARNQHVWCDPGRFFPYSGLALTTITDLPIRVNPITAATVYKLTLSGDGYLYDGKAVPFETHESSIKVKQPDGSLKGNACHSTNGCTGAGL